MRDEASRKNIIKQVLETIAKSLVDDPDSCSVTITHGESTCVYELRTAKGDTGKVVGKLGKMAEALRTITKSLSAKNKIRGVLEICD